MTGMPVEISRSDLFTVTTLGCLTALVAWFAITWTLRRAWDAYVDRRAAERPPAYPMGIETEGQRIMRANSDLSLAALDVPDHAGTGGMEPWQRDLIAASQRYKMAIPERNQQMMRADRRARQE